MTPTRLSRLVAVLASATLLGGGLAAADQRGDRDDARREAAAVQSRLAALKAADDARLSAEEKRAAAARAARTAWQRQLAPVAAGVVTHVQPLLSAFEAIRAKRSDYGPNVRDDVLARGGSVDGLTVLRTRLAAVRPPVAAKAEHAAVVKALGDLRRAAVALDAATRGKADRKGLVQAFGPAVDALDEAVRAWARAVGVAFDDDDDVAVPTSGVTLPTQRARGAYLQKIGERCAVALQQSGKRFDATPESTAESARVLDGLAVLDSRTLGQVLAVPRPATRAAAALPAVLADHRRKLDALAAALDPDQPFEVQVARVGPLVDTVSASRDAAVRALTAVGSRTCVLVADDL